MRFIIDISITHKQKIQKYLDKGAYPTLADFITTAIENQLYLEEDSLPGALNEPQTQYSTLVANSTSGMQADSTYMIKSMENFYSVIPPPAYNNLVLSNQKLPEKDTWMWGQINKIFPVKVGLRILQRRLGNNQLIDLNDYLEVASKDAASIGQQIRDYEEEQSKNRSEKISAGFPQVNDEKSQLRYKFQFLAYLRKDELLDGAMALLRFCNLDKKNNKVQIGLTEAGAMFSQITNPVLDELNFNSPFNEAEIEFYLNHIKKNVLSEYWALKWLLNVIDNGENDREKINQKLLADFGNKWNATDAVINTQRSGVTARAFELKLIQKVKNGIYVTYNVTDSGKSFLYKM